MKHDFGTQDSYPQRPLVEGAGVLVMNQYLSSGNNVTSAPTSDQYNLLITKRRKRTARTPPPLPPLPLPCSPVILGVVVVVFVAEEKGRKRQLPELTSIRGSQTADVGAKGRRRGYEREDGI